MLEERKKDFPLKFSTDIRRIIRMKRRINKSPTTLPCVFHAKIAMAARRTRSFLRVLRFYPFAALRELKTRCIPLPLS